MAASVIRALMLVLALAAARVEAQTPAPSGAASPVRFSGYLQARETYQKDIGLSGSINRARLTAAGGIVQSVTWRIQGEFRTGSVGTGKASVALQDAYMRYAPGPFALQIGQFKTPFTREFTTPLADVESADRSTVVDSLAPKRDIGVMGEYAFGKHASLAVGVFNGEGQNVTANRDSTALGVARLVVHPLPAVSLGANAALYFSDSTRFGFDASYEGVKLTARAEYLEQHRNGLALADDQGWYGLVGYFVVPTVQVIGKYEWFKRRGLTPTQRNRAWTGGVNLYPFNRNTRIVVEYLSRKVGDAGVTKEQILTQFQVKF